MCTETVSIITFGHASVWDVFCPGRHLRDTTKLYMYLCESITCVQIPQYAAGRVVTGLLSRGDVQEKQSVRQDKRERQHSHMLADRMESNLNKKLLTGS